MLQPNQQPNGFRRPPGHSPTTLPRLRFCSKRARRDSQCLPAQPPSKHTKAIKSNSERGAAPISAALMIRVVKDGPFIIVVF